MRTLSHLLAVLIVLGGSLVADAEDCTNGHALYVGQHLAPDGVGRIVAYRSTMTGSSGTLMLEGWTGQALIWRIKARRACRDGGADCSVRIPLTNGEFIEATETTIGEDGRPSYLILADLEKSSFEEQVLSAQEPSIGLDWSSYDASTGQPVIVLPSVYKADDCRSDRPSD